MREFHSFLAQPIQRFIHFKQASHCWSDSYEKNLVYFDRFCREEFPGAESLTQKMIDDWCRQRDTETSSSCRSRIGVVCSFVRFLNDRGLSSVLPPETPRKKRHPYIPHAFTEDEMTRFFHECDNIPSFNRKNSRVRKLTIPVFFRLLYSSGIRTNEARLLLRKNVDLSKGILDIQRSKGHDQHYVVLHDSMLRIMNEYDFTVQKLIPDREYFFPSSRNGHYNCGWVVKTFNQMWSKVSTAHATAYDFRHHYAITNINGWVGHSFDFHDRFVYLSKSMGHTKLESTKYYYSVVPALSYVLDEKTGESSNWMIPEVPDEEIL